MLLLMVSPSLLQDARGVGLARVLPRSTACSVSHVTPGFALRGVFFKYAG